MSQNVRALLLAALLGWSFLIALGQDIVVPSNWLGSTSGLSRESREALASGAATALLAHVDPTVQTAPNLGSSPPDLPHVRYFGSTFAVLALQDYYSGNSTWNDTATNGLLDYLQAYGFYGAPSPSSTANTDSVYWGLVSFYAYRTYRQQPLLDQAVAAYNVTYTSGFITPGAAFTGTGAGRNVSFFPPRNCTANGTYAGGVFVYRDMHSATDINAYTVGAFMTLSAYLFEETGDPVYRQAAQLSLDFAINHLWNGTVFQDAFDPLSCTVAPTWISFDQWFVEGLSVWANVTKNDTLTSFLETVVTSVTTFPSYSLLNGIIIEGYSPQDWASIDKGIFIRALVEARRRNPNTALADYIEAYVTVQFNAILTHARAPNTDFYTTAWSSGPTNSTFIASGNIAALDVLNAAFSFVAPPHSASSSGGSSPAMMHSNTAKLMSKPNAGAIAGGVVGGIVASAIILAAFWWRRRHNHTNNDPILHQGSSRSTRGGLASNVEPFVLQSSRTRSSKLRRFYTTGRDDETRLSSATPAEAMPTSSSTQDRGYDQDTTSEHTEFQTLLRRLHDLILQGRNGSGELPPPQYED
ncbi:hypothetical protein PENSPDRAFT_656575 [Peniophora sp. CONT]|nr:hypothetical protein PENSPDRAFT_656575 [Peniophora sp. CONT]